MKKLIVIAALLACVKTSGYYKFRCADYMKVGGRDICGSVLAKVAPQKSAAHYTMEDSFGMCHVYLSASDKKRIVGALSRFKKTPDTVITKDLIHEFTPSSWRPRHVIGLVLQDFAMLKNQATVNDVLSALNLAQ